MLFVGNSSTIKTHWSHCYTKCLFISGDSFSTICNNSTTTTTTAIFFCTAYTKFFYQYHTNSGKEQICLMITVFEDATMKTCFGHFLGAADAGSSCEHFTITNHNGIKKKRVAAALRSMMIWVITSFHVSSRTSWDSLIVLFLRIIIFML